MRLINVKTLALEEFQHNIPPYAILSHTWGSDEVTFQEYQEYLHFTTHYLCPGTNASNSNIEIKAGFAKIMGACRRARDDNLGYLWCDTNCIDKSSSAELTEAINSMYAWYRDSAVCYAYLAEADALDRTGMVTKEFRKSRWFTRGWTLQELLAPKEVLFFNADWRSVGNRQRLATVICEITRIHKGALENRDAIFDYSVAQRMSWAAGRQTSRQEDIAYSLLGIFEINMPLLYGEGSKAFTRLQEEIVKGSDDHSILAWDFYGDQGSNSTGMLASSPSDFASCGSIVRDDTVTRRPYSITNIGISLELPMIKSLNRGNVLVELNCSVELQEYRSPQGPQAKQLHLWRFPVWIWLNRTGDNIYERSWIPTSRTSLLDFYSEGADCVITRIYGITNTPSQVEPRTLRASPSRANRSTSTGFHITIGFGRIAPRTRILQQAFPPGHFVVSQLPPRGSPAVSHEIVSAGSYVVLLTIIWDRQQLKPMHWDYTTFVNLEDNVILQMSRNNWDILFQTQPRDDSAVWIDFIHDQIWEQLDHPTLTTEANAAPHVHIEDSLAQDQHGQAKVIAHVTFQELGESR